MSLINQLSMEDKISCEQIHSIELYCLNTLLTYRNKLGTFKHNKTLSSV